jgi:hypothetical protein
MRRSTVSKSSSAARNALPIWFARFYIRLDLQLSFSSSRTRASSATSIPP